MYHSLSGRASSRSPPRWFNLLVYRNGTMLERPSNSFAHFYYLGRTGAQTQREKEREKQGARRRNLLSAAKKKFKKGNYIVGSRRPARTHRVSIVAVVR